MLMYVKQGERFEEKNISLMDIRRICAEIIHQDPATRGVFNKDKLKPKYITSSSVSKPTPQSIKVQIVPETVSAEITIKSPSKELPLKFVTKGSVAFGYAIKTIEASDTKVTVWGASEAINELKFIEVEVNVSDIKTNQKYKLEINKPSGVRNMSISTVNVDITLDASADRELDNVGLIWRNLDLSKYKVQASSASDTNVTIILKGVASVINDIQPTDVTAYLDLSGYTEGEYEVDVQVEGNDTRVEYVAKTKKVKVKIAKIG